MSKKKSHPIQMVVVIFVIGFLLLFGSYMWTQDYSVRRPQESMMLRATLKLDEFNEFAGVGPQVLLTVQNASVERVRLVDTRRIDPLYNIIAERKGENGSWEPMLAKRLPPRKPDEAYFDKDVDSVVELVAGSGHVRVIPLTILYDFNKPSRYRVQVEYKPAALQAVMGDNFYRLDVSEQVLVQSVEFDWPRGKSMMERPSLLAPVPAPAPAPVPAPSTVPGTEPPATK